MTETIPLWQLHVYAAALEPVLFVALGAFVAVGFVQPATIPQAIAAGIGWTGLFSK
jgi:hypothetical protein